MKNKLLVVYNTCGVAQPRHPGGMQAILGYYIHSIEGLLNQNFEGYKIVVSMYKNAHHYKKLLAQKFGNKISYVFYDEGNLTVNQTYNKTVQLCVEKFGKFEGYLYVNSGMSFGPIRTSHHPIHGSADHDANYDVLSELYRTFKSGPYGLVSIQVDWDAGYSTIGYQYDSGPPAQIQGEDFIIPVGKAVNGHMYMASNELFEAYDNKIIPDVFRAFCTESVFSFLTSAIQKKWVIMKDILLHHQGALEGPSSAEHSQTSVEHKNSWNNLLCGRNALDFINDPEAIEAGLGYEECNEIMLHKEEAFDENGYAKYSEKLREINKKYLFLSKDEFDYNTIRCNAIWGS